MKTLLLSALLLLQGYNVPFRPQPAAGGGPATIQAIATTQAATATAIAVTLPSGSTDGDLVIINVGSRGSGAWTQTSGTTNWTELAVDANGQSAYWKEIGAGEATPSFDQDSGAANLGAIAWRIDGHADPSTDPPEISSQATAVSTTPDPPSHTPSADADLWLAIIKTISISGISSGPSGYSTPTTSVTGTGSQTLLLSGADLTTTASTEDPGTYSIAASRNWWAITISVESAP